MTFGTMRKRAEQSIHQRLGINISQNQANLARQYSTRVALGEITADKAAEEIRNA